MHSQLTELFQGPDSNTKLVESLKRQGIFLVPKEGEVRLGSLEEVHKRAVQFNQWVRSHFWELFPQLIVQREESKAEESAYPDLQTTIRPEETPEFLSFENLELIEPATLFKTIFDSFKLLRDGLNVAHMQAQQRFKSSIAHHLAQDFGISMNSLPLGCKQQLNPHVIPPELVNMNYLTGKMSDQEYESYYRINHNLSKPMYFANQQDPQVRAIYAKVLSFNPEFQKNESEHERDVNLYMLSKAVNFVRLHRGSFADKQMYNLASSFIHLGVALRAVSAQAHASIAMMRHQQAESADICQSFHKIRLQREISKVDESYLQGSLLRNMFQAGCPDLGISDYLRYNEQAGPAVNARRTAHNPFTMKMKPPGL